MQKLSILFSCVQACRRDDASWPHAEVSVELNLVVLNLAGVFTAALLLVFTSPGYC
jgi:hypothetical protein